jgi:hypothetical protein
MPTRSLATPPTRPPPTLRCSPRQRTSRPVSAAYASQSGADSDRCAQRRHHGPPRGGHHGPHLGIAGLCVAIGGLLLTWRIWHRARPRIAVIPKSAFTGSLTRGIGTG